MSVFSKAVNGFRSTASRASKYYGSLPSQVAMRNSKYLAYAPKVGIGTAAAGAAVGAAAGGRDRRGSGAMKGAAVGALGGVSLWGGGLRRLGSGSAIRGMLK